MKKKKGQLHQQEIFKYVKHQKKGSRRGFLYISPEGGVEFPVNQNGTKEEKTGQKTGRGNRRSTLPNTLPGQADTIQTEVPLDASTYDPPVIYTTPPKRLTFCHRDKWTPSGEYGKTSRKIRDWSLPLCLLCLLSVNYTHGPAHTSR